MQLFDALSEENPQAAEKLIVKFEVNEIDPDFSFRKALEAE